MGKICPERSGSARTQLEQALERCAVFGMKPGLDAVRTVCATMGDPQDSLRVVHVAGTNGKGAVCALVDSALRAAGFRTGRYTSPHLVSLNERFFLDGAPVQEEKLDAAFAAIRDADALTYFELLTVTAFELYRREKVDYLVLETGLGGRLDATNIVKRPEVCVITRIGLDHCDWLGHTIAEIASEKGGIIKPGVPVVLGAMPDEARAVLENIAAERDAPCVYAPDSALSGDFGESGLTGKLALGGKFNRENAITALAALKVLCVGSDAIGRGFSSVVWPGRFQRIAKDGKSFLVDGAHNPPAMRALVDAVKEDMSLSLSAAICGFCGDKDVASNLRTLREIVDVGYAVPIRNPRSLTPERTAALMREAGFREAHVCGSVEEAIAKVPTGAVVCGSLFLAGEALEVLGAIPCGRYVPNEAIRGIIRPNSDFQKASAKQRTKDEEERTAEE